MDDEKNESTEIVGNIQNLPIDRLNPFENHPFKEYEGERLDKKLIAALELYRSANPE